MLDEVSRHLSPSWQRYLGEEFEQPYMQQLSCFLAAEAEMDKEIYPKSCDIFNAFNLTAFNDVRVVILGQDPYHGAGQAHGLCFSVPRDVRCPPSLVNVFKEIHRDFDYPMPKHGCLNTWAEQGVLLLNAILTVEQGCAGSHQGKGWEAFTDKAIQCLNEHREGIVFLLWGAYAQKKGRWIDTEKHCVLMSPHPSPLSAYRGFLGNQHFSQANQYLLSQGQAVIDWNINS
jgi:uracil-DNA glycosylase